MRRLLEDGDRDLAYRVVKAAALEAARVLADEAREMRAAEARRVSGGDLSPKMGVRSYG